SRFDAGVAEFRLPYSYCDDFWARQDTSTNRHNCLCVATSCPSDGSRAAFSRPVSYGGKQSVWNNAHATAFWCPDTVISSHDSGGCQSDNYDGVSNGCNCLNDWRRWPGLPGIAGNRTA